ncbi:hypothetical protein AYY16_09705 [Morganella psychrotolerans]|nr:hypothetical protein AYY16_09705 [Morganella psychrotolerans]
MIQICGSGQTGKQRVVHCSAPVPAEPAFVNTLQFIKKLNLSLENIKTKILIKTIIFFILHFDKK